MSNHIIKTTGLNYFFSRGQQTLYNINLQVEKGAIYGFLGPNGAGKTTTLRLLLGLLTNQEGKIELFGEDLVQNRIGILKRLGSLIEQPSLYSHLTAKENLEVYRRTYGVEKTRVAEVLQLVGLQDTGKKTAKQFSLGMKQRLSIAIALLHNPELLILDEPTNGLDPNGIIETRELIKRLNKEMGVTIIVSSHILAEVEKMASHVGIIHKGKMLFQGSLNELHALKNKKSFVHLNTSNNDAAFELLKSAFAVERVNGHLTVPFKDNVGTATVNRMLLTHNIDVFLLQPQQNDLEQLFIDITNDNL